MIRILFVFTLLIYGCASVPKHVISEVKLQEALKQNADKIVSFRGGGTFSMKFGTKEGSVEALVLAETPGKVRIETGSFLGFPISVLTMRQGKLSYYQIPQEKFYVGKSSMISKVLPFEIKEKDFFGLLFFKKEIFENFKQHPLLKLTVYEMRKDEKHDLFYPGGFKIEDRKTHDFLEVTWEEFDLNPLDISKEHFFLEKPPQAERVALSVATRLRGVIEDTSQETIDDDK